MNESGRFVKGIIVFVIFVIIVATVIIIIFQNNSEPIVIEKGNIQELLDERLTGDNVKVAIIDTGINQELIDYFESYQLTYYNVVDESDEVLDTHSHGSRVTCVMLCVPVDLNDKGLIPNAEFMIIKAYDDFGHIKPEYISSAVDYARENDVDIINLSIGTLTDYSDIERSINEATVEGIIIIASYGDEEEMYPAKYDEVYSVSISSIDTDTDFIVSIDVFELACLVNNIHDYQDKPTSSFSSAVATSFIALLIEKCNNEGTEFNIKK